MSLIAWPTWLEPRTCRFALEPNQRVNASPFGGSEQVIDMLTERWVCSLEFSARRSDEGARFEAFIASLRGQANTTGLFHFRRRVPRGTLRGAPTLSASAAQGSAAVSVVAPGGATLLAGDMLGIGGLLLMVQSDCSASGGTIVVPLVNRLRKGLSNGAAVTWDRPAAQFRLLTRAAGLLYVPGSAAPVSLDFGEAIP